VNEPKPLPETPAEEGQDTGSSEERRSSSPAVRGSRWIDYDTHELLEMISELEDERRWARLREGALWAVLIHMAVLLGLFLLPKYVFKVPPVVDRAKITDTDVFTYLDTPRFRPKVEPKPLAKPPVIDNKTLEEMRKQTPPAPAPPPETKAPEPAPEQQQATPPIPPKPQSQSQLEAPRPAAVPARPNFAMGPQNPADAMRDAMRNSARGQGSGQTNLGPNALSMHPGAGTGGIQVLSDTQGVDFSSWLQRWHYETEHTWDPLIPDEVNPPISKAGQLVIRFKVAPNGRVIDGSMMLEGSSGDVALDRAAWGAITGSSYPPLPRDFHGPYIELRAWFLYNMEPPR
jgi:outer membrane biosynthesis protein TonB